MSRRRRGGGGEEAMVPEADFRSYHGRAVLKRPVWKADVPAYFFAGGVMAGSSLLAAGADLTGNGPLRRPTRLLAAGALTASSALLVHDLGRPSRALNMLRMTKPSSPMSVGSWLLAGYGPGVVAAVLAEATGRFPGLGRAGGLAAAALAPAVATYTAVLLSDTPSRRGTTPAPTCRSCSSGARRPPPVVWPPSSSRRAPPVPPAGWPFSGRWPTSWHPAAWRRRWA